MPAGPLRSRPDPSRSQDPEARRERAGRSGGGTVDRRDGVTAIEPVFEDTSAEVWAITHGHQRRSCQHCGASLSVISLIAAINPLSVVRVCAFSPVERTFSSHRFRIASPFPPRASKSAALAWASRTLLVRPFSAPLINPSLDWWLGESLSKYLRAASFSGLRPVGSSPSPEHDEANRANTISIAPGTTTPRFNQETGCW